MFDDLPKSERDQHWAEILSKFSITKPFIKTTSPYTKYKRVIEEAEGVVATKREINTGHIDRLVEGYLFHKNVKIDEIREAIRSAGKADGKDEADRLFDRFVFQRKVEDLDNRIFWLRLQKLVPEARAIVFNKIWSKASLARKDDMRYEMSVLRGRYEKSRKKGIFSDQFFRELAKIQAEERVQHLGK